MIKKYIILIPVLFAVFSFCQCKNDNSVTDGKSSSEQVVDTVKEEAAPLSDTIRVAINTINPIYERNKSITYNWIQLVCKPIYEKTNNINKEVYYSSDKELHKFISKTFEGKIIKLNGKNNTDKFFGEGTIGVNIAEDNVIVYDNLKILYNWSKDTIQSSEGVGTEVYLNTKDAVKEEIEELKAKLEEIAKTNTRFRIISFAGIVGLILFLLLFSFLFWKIFSRIKESENNKESINRIISEKIEQQMSFANNESDKDKNNRILSEISAKITSIEKQIDVLSQRVQTLEEKSVSAAVKQPAESDKKINIAPIAPIVEKVKYYYESPSNDSFMNPTNRDNPAAVWIVELTDDNASEGVYYLNPKAFSFFKNHIDSFVKPFADILNHKEVQAPTKVDYVKYGKVQRTAGGWKIVEKVKFNLI